MSDLREIQDIDEMATPLEEITDEWIEYGNYSQQTVADLRDALKIVLSRNELFEKCFERALKMWQKENPEAEFWLDGAKNLKWIFDRLEKAEGTIWAIHAILPAAGLTHSEMNVKRLSENFLYPKSKNKKGVLK
jgi:hypothetical protein